MQISLASSIPGFAAKRTAAEVEAILRDARPWLYRLALAISAKPDLAEDITQDALIRAAKSSEKLRSVTEPHAWLRTVLVRCAVTALGRIPPVPEVEGVVATDPTESLAVQGTLSRLNPADRALLALAHFEELSYAEIGAALDIPVGTVASRLHAARDAFRKEWRK